MHNRYAPLCAIACASVVLPTVRAGATSDGIWSIATSPNRANHATIYDPVRDRLVRFGGDKYDGKIVLSDVWVLPMGTPSDWMEIAPSGSAPPARHDHTMIYDPVRDRAIVFGGRSNSDVFDDVWVLDLAGTPTWSEVAGSGPGARYWHAAVYDAFGDRMIVFGGRSAGGNDLNDVWALSLSGTPTWTLLTPTGTSPTPRCRVAATYDPVASELVLFGGYDGSYLDDVWTLALSGGTPAWSTISVLGNHPSARADAGLIYDPTHPWFVVVGGSAFGTPADATVWALDLSGTPDWLGFAPTGITPETRRDGSIVFDSIRGDIVLEGGVRGGSQGGDLTDVWTLSVATPDGDWTDVTPANYPPRARYGHSTVVDPAGDRMLLFGGFSNDWTNDVWSVSLGTPTTWERLEPVGTHPPVRRAHVAIWDAPRNRMVIAAGAGEGGTLGDVWALRFSPTLEWESLGNAPFTESSGRAVYDPVDDRMLVLVPSTNTAWALDLATDTWSLIPTTGGADIGGSPAVVYDPVRHRVVIQGGNDGSPPFGYGDKTWSLDLDPTPAWTALPDFDPVAAHRAVYDPLRDRMVIFGGDTNGGPLPLLAALPLGSQSEWTYLSAQGDEPAGTAAHSVVYDATRDRMVVCGGIGSPGRFNDVAFLDWGFAVEVPAPVSGVAPVRLEPARPNPFRASTVLRYVAPPGARVTVSVFDVAGRHVVKLADDVRADGRREITWNGRDDRGITVPAGVYFVQLSSGGDRALQRVQVVR